MLVSSKLQQRHIAYPSQYQFPYFLITEAIMCKISTSVQQTGIKENWVTPYIMRIEIIALIVRAVHSHLFRRDRFLYAQVISFLSKVSITLDT